MKQIRNHKKICIITGVVLVILAIAGYFLVPYVKRHYVPVSVNLAKATEMEKVDWGEKKILTVYFTRVGNTDFEEDVDAVSSASLMKDGEELVGNSQLLAAMVQKSVGGDVYAIQTQKKYPSSYGDTVSVSRDEIDSNENTTLVGDLPDIRQYDTVVLVYPVWWGTIPNAVRTFLQSDDLSGITLYPLITHGGSGAANSVEDIKAACGAKVSDKCLEILDDDVTEAAGQVAAWLRAM
ncbi:MAG: hypothetical protein NC293_13665 [Roseburia sp.]|nr:hypothetical protein [Roseburia sp.]